MNAVADNEFTRALAALGGRLGAPQAILCVSAHWLTDGSRVTGMLKPRTIHDFGGFPETLYRVLYPAPGSPALARRVRELLSDDCELDSGEWGLDHGAWSVLKFMFPNADIPVVQLSIDFRGPARHFLELGRSLRPLRNEGVLIIGSGNMVHNLRKIDFDADAAPFDWAVEFDEWAKGRLLERDLDALCDGVDAAPSGQLAVPTMDHYAPMLYALGAGDTDDEFHFEFEGIQNGSISMRAFSLGLP